MSYEMIGKAMGQVSWGCHPCGLIWGQPENEDPACPKCGPGVGLEFLAMLDNRASGAPWLVTDGGAGDSEDVSCILIGSALDTSYEATICVVEGNGNHSRQDWLAIIALRNLLPQFRAAIEAHHIHAKQSGGVPGSTVSRAVIRDLDKQVRAIKARYGDGS